MIHRTKKQIETSDYIFKFVKKHKRYPTIEEVMNKFNLKSTSSAWNRIETHKEISETIGRCQCCGRKL